MGIGLGLGAALAWGTADVLATIASRRTGSFRVVLGFHVAAVAFLALLVAATGASVRAVSGGDLAWLAFVGLLGALAYLTFYRALAIGPISIVSPIVAAYAAVTVVLAVAIGGERPGPGEIAAVVVVVLGVLLASSDLAGIRRLERVALLGIVLALVTAVVIGGFVYGVAHFGDEHGWLVPVFVARALSALFLLALSLRGRSWRFPDRSPALLGLIAAVGVVDTAAYVLFSVGSRHADTSVVATAAAPYAVVPIVAGVFLFGERPRASQWAGIALVLAGLVLLGLSA
ncbi:MAG TPA: DMT family transporter [Gaiellaceae bacterium]|nr:DMT family transporter [Gaiellaceae bacterium]